MVGKASFDFEGESAVVTGSTKGIGRGIAKGLVEAGANVVVNSRTPEDVRKTADELGSLGPGSVHGVAADVAEPEGIERLSREAIGAIGPIDLLVNNAAIWREDHMLEASLDDWNDTIDVNVRSQFYLSQLLARHMVEEGTEGTIVNVTSQTGDRRSGPRRFYGVSNTAVNGLTWRMACDFAEHGIRVNAISTDVTETHQLRKEAREVAADSDRTTEEVLADWGEKRPMGRLGQPQDLADGVLFLASNRADYVTGHILRVSGGGNLQ